MEKEIKYFDIMACIEKHGKVTVKKLVKKLSAPEDTIRRLLDWLLEGGFVCEVKDGVYKLSKHGVEITEWWKDSLVRDERRAKLAKKLEKQGRLPKEPYKPGEGEDERLLPALVAAFNSDKITPSILQGHLRIGFDYAVRLIKQMEDLGYVTRSDGSTPRKLLITEEQFIETYGPFANIK